MSNGQLFTNNAIALLEQPISSSSNNIVVQATHGGLFPNPGPGEFFLITLEELANPLHREIVKISGRTGDVLHVAERGAEGTTARAWTAQETLVDHRITANTIKEAFLYPAIPANVSYFNNDAGYITLADLPWPATRTVTANYTATQSDYYIGVNSSGPVIITLPNTLHVGTKIVVKDESGACESNNITISGPIDNSTSATLAINNGSLTFIFHNNAWRII